MTNPESGPPASPPIPPPPFPPDGLYRPYWTGQSWAFAPIKRRNPAPIIIAAVLSFIFLYFAFTGLLFFAFAGDSCGSTMDCGNTIGIWTVAYLGALAVAALCTIISLIVTLSNKDLGMRRGVLTIVGADFVVILVFVLAVIAISQIPPIS
jgi:hypothetical protein